MHHQDPVTIYSTTNMYEAEIIRNVLHDEGIACQINDELQAGFTDLFEIRLVVRAEDADRAAKIIAQHQEKE